MEVGFNKIDVRRCLIAYIGRTKEWQRSTSLFVLFAGSNRGKRASKYTIEVGHRGGIQSSIPDTSVRNKYSFHKRGFYFLA